VVGGVLLGATVLGWWPGSSWPPPSRSHRRQRWPSGASRSPSSYPFTSPESASGLDLIHGFDVVFFVGFVLAACLIKATSVYLGARAAGEDSFSSLNLAIAMNARGGPGIVVASTAFSAGIINQDFFAVLVLLAIITSLAAGTWLERVPRHRLLTRPARTAGRAMVVEGDTVT
jgi:hypothetical protein